MTLRPKQRAKSRHIGMKELLEYMARSLVNHPDMVHVHSVASGYSVLFELEVSPGDKGMVIGRRGRIANTMRSLLRVAASTEGKRATLDII